MAELGAKRNGRLSVEASTYLGNLMEAPLAGVSVTCGSPMNPELAPAAMVPAGENSTVAPGTGVLFDKYGLMWDGDAPILYEVAVTDADSRFQRSRALIEKDCPVGDWLALKALNSAC
ncbi:hypothetical protein MKK75_12140 [Methylobacterium sp. J-030]|uniref:hypothetical protein n=1 Tax=Methylobacterium sp. J-030 TaxID=2836627 RepID=UPI001FB9D5F4|nr:hypothetical protein [Methylobacterium sp. J-030]MCJ2069531.1 hypothetical protein [Methylobacterium sp. J-030]